MVNHLTTSHKFHQINWKSTPCPTTKTQYLPLFIVKWKLKCHHASWLSLTQIECFSFACLMWKSNFYLLLGTCGAFVSTVKLWPFVLLSGLLLKREKMAHVGYSDNLVFLNRPSARIFSCNYHLPLSQQILIIYTENNSSSYMHA